MTFQILSTKMRLPCGSLNILSCRVCYAGRASLVVIRSALGAGELCCDMWHLQRWHFFCVYICIHFSIHCIYVHRMDIGNTWYYLCFPVLYPGKWKNKALTPQIFGKPCPPPLRVQHFPASSGPLVYLQKDQEVTQYRRSEASSELHHA